jgi:hypothetical protein
MSETLFDTRQLTTQRMEIATSLVSKLKPHCVGIMISGSLAYGPNHSVKPTSDIDMLVVVDDLKQSFPEMRDRQPNELEKFSPENFDGYSFKRLFIDGVKVSFRVVTREVFSKICDAETGDVRIYKPVVKREETTTQGFDGSEKKHQVAQIPLSQITEYVRLSPNAVIVDGNYQIGTYLDRILSCGKVLHDTDGWMASQMERCWDNVGAVLVNESERRMGGMDLDRMSIGKALCRHTRMPDESRAYVKSRTEQAVERHQQSRAGLAA